ncbi:hypothetical protein CEXT_470711 [Caerostris extrusa]|uniref:Uncharacterized protein n=1 Tax=Caerostris extrusa TaxID=172846 RepID=A0AAV4TWT5_CAEEX|nr:hypothetical protein CEXT_470711 [Caerostris extrusa]
MNSTDYDRSAQLWPMAAAGQVPNGKLPPSISGSHVLGDVLTVSLRRQRKVLRRRPGICMSDEPSAKTSFMNKPRGKRKWLPKHVRNRSGIRAEQLVITGRNWALLI